MSAGAFFVFTTLKTLESMFMGLEKSQKGPERFKNGATKGPGKSE